MSIAIAERGDGPPVVLIHGAPSATSDFDALMATLAHDHRVLVPSLPGYGASAKLERYSLVEVRSQLRDALHAHGIVRAALVGLSAGAYHAFALAAHGFDASIVIGLGAFAHTNPVDAPSLRGFADSVRTMRNFGDRALREMFANRMLSERWRTSHPEDIAEVAAWLDATTPSVLADELAAFCDVEDLRPALASLKIKIVARVGELDVAAPPIVSEAIISTCHSGSLQVVPGCGHALLVEDEVATIAAVRAAVVAA
jgi:3-oxoadipate enol-lactonase